MRRVARSLVAAVVLAAGCAGGDGSGTAPSTEASSTATSDAPQDAYAVGSREIELVDTSRPTAADPSRGMPERPERTLPVLVLYPAEGEPTTPTEVVEGAPAAEGVFPLVIFSHGVNAEGPTYENRLKEWARAGYVVAAPTHPLSSGDGGQISDYVHQPADVSFVLDELLSLPDDDPLAARIDPERSATAGHSLGAITSLGVGLSSCCADPRLDAVVSLAGIRLPLPNGEVDDIDRLPFLAVHGAADATIPVSGSDTLFTEAAGPAAYLRIEDAGHSDIVRREGPLVDAAVVAFLDQHLGGDDDALDAIAPLVAERGHATFQVKPAP
jgi:fermentation-respiration switch protein FrsA (DUF1100 family)